ncbi:TLD-domain-containing protein [Haematococcus lacustris]
MRFFRAPDGVLPLTSAHQVGHLGPFALGALAAVFVLAAAVILYRRSRLRTVFGYTPFSPSTQDPAECVVVDCTAPRQYITLSHHKGSNNPPGLPPSDTSTGLVLSAIQANFWGWGSPLLTCSQLPFVTTNHFDIDSFLSVWCYTNRQQALRHEPVLRHMARIGDFREGCLAPDLVARHGHMDGVTSIREALTALKLCCWLNTLERRLFSAPYETKDCEDKFAHFLPRFAAVLADPEAAWADWQDEYKKVMGGFEELVQGNGCEVVTVDKVGLAVLHCAEPMHYYSLFSHTHGADVVLMMFDGNRYEVECKYTQYVHVHTRPVWPRLDLSALALVLNQLEGQALPPGTAWTANRITDTGPLLRLEHEEQHLTKAQRYGHPYERPILASSLPPATMAACVQSCLEFGLQGVSPKRGGWSWEELHDLNQAIPWQSWVHTVLEQHRQGELLQHSPDLVRVLGRRCSMEQQGTALPSPPPGQAFQPVMSDGGSGIMTKDEVAALVAGCLPARFKQSRWSLLYCTQRDGISLHTLYRKAAGKAPSLLVVRDSGGAVFGAFATEPWRVSPRFFGTGETRVFQLQPRRAVYCWQPPRSRGGEGQPTSNDYFQFATPEGLGVGGAGHFAIWMDNDLLEGSSAQCLTFDSPCLSSAPEFHIRAIELWHLI